jgi:PAT family beta-lactamase induction signal transducer AmpG
MAALMLLGVATVLFRPSLRALLTARNAVNGQTALIEPFADSPAPLRQAGRVLALIAVYRISDVVMGIMANPFYVDMATPRTKCSSRDQDLRRHHDALGRVCRRVRWPCALG